MRIALSTLFIFISCAFNPLTAQNNYWKTNEDRSRLTVEIQTTKSMIYDLEVTEFRAFLEKAPMKHEPQRFRYQYSLLLPTPEGRMDTFEIFKTALMEVGLQEKYPGIQTFKAFKKGNPATTGTLDITYQGFHAMIFEEGKQWFIDPINRNDSLRYQVYYKSDFVTEKKMNCLVTDEHKAEQEEMKRYDRSFRNCSMRTYRTCVAATGEYSQYHGGTKPLVMSAIVTTINRVNSILNMDMAINLILIENNDEVVYLDDATDPYTNEDGGAMLSQNISTLNSIIGSANYDFGHVFSTGGGGVAYLNSVCGGLKAGGVTGLANPINDPFDVDYVAHEMGHQMGGNHTQNNSCNRSNQAAFEPGSASTIMGYAGICAPNVQNNSDAYYHVKSLEEMTTYMYNGNGNSCAHQISLDNQAPEIVEIPNNLTLPILTPFELTAIATDADDDELLYCWEQYDNEIGDMPPSPFNSQGPVFRSIYPTTDPTRVFPNINAVVNNQSTTWEVLPAVTRSMNFKVTVRDRFEDIGCIDIASASFNFDNSAGPFVVNYPNSTGILIPAGENIEIEWDVANTNAGAVNASSVDIFLSVDGGYTYPITLASNVPNTGTASVSMPAVETSLARVKVKGHNHVFFDISDNDFSIEITNSTFIVLFNKSFTSLCPGESDVFELTSQSLLGYAGEISLSIVSPIPQGLTAVLTNETIEVGETSSLSLNYNSFDPGGTYILEILATDGEIERIISITVVLTGVPSEVMLLSPSFEQNSVAVQPEFFWSHDPNATIYHLEVSPDYNFEVDVLSYPGLVDNSFVFPQVLDQLTTYYWRVLPSNNCIEGNVSARGIFQTTNCIVYMSEDVPVLISASQSIVVSSDLTIPHSQFGPINDLDVVNVQGTHTWVEDLIFRVKKDGSTVTLVDQVCGSDDDFSFSFDDEAALTTIVCGQPAGNGLTYQPLESLSLMYGMEQEGLWTMEVEDIFPEDGGSLESWGIKICYENGVCRPVGIPVSEGIYIADSECTDELGWTHYYKSATASPVTENEVLLLSIKKDDVVEISPNQVIVGLGNEPVLNLPNVQYVPNPGIWYVMSRYWEVLPSVQPGAEGCQVRFYFPEEEAAELVDIAGLVYGLGQLRSFKFATGSGIDPNPINGHQDAGVADFVLFTPDYDEFNIKLYAEFGVDGFSGGGIGAGGELPLPIDLLSFTGKDTEEGHHLMWKTANADRFSRFELESSLDGKNFRGIGTVFYNVNLSDYLFINTQIKSEITYYRLKMIDLDESFTYSPIISLRRQNLGAIEIFPNPAKEILKVKMSNQFVSKQIEIVNSLGQVVKSINTDSENVLEINVGSLVPGIYFLHVSSEQGIQHFEFVKM